MNTDIEIIYKYCKIELEQFAILEDTYQSDMGDTQIQTGVQFSYDQDQHIICCDTSVILIQGDKTLLKTQLKSYFDLQPESVEALKEDGAIVFDEPLLIQFASLSYGSLRGVIYAKTLNTPFNNFILPPVYFSSIIDKPFVV